MDTRPPQRRERKTQKPLTAESLKWVALRYGEGYSTTREKQRQSL